MDEVFSKARQLRMEYISQVELRREKNPFVDTTIPLWIEVIGKEAD
jgi:hypothetical protein